MENTFRKIKEKKWQIEFSEPEGHQEVHFFNQNLPQADPNEIVSRFLKMARAEMPNPENHFEEIERGHTLIRFRATTDNGRTFLRKMENCLKYGPGGKRIDLKGFARKIWMQRWAYTPKEGSIRFVSTAPGNPTPTPVIRSLRQLLKESKLALGKGKDLEVKVRRFGNVEFTGGTDRGKAHLMLLKRFFRRTDRLATAKMNKSLLEKKAPA